MSIRFDRWVDSITFTLLEFGAADIRVDGYINAKTVPYAMISQVIAGHYEATVGDLEMQCPAGTVLFAPPGVPIKVVHRLDPQRGGLTNRFAHLRLTLWGGIDVFSLLRPKPLFRAAEAEEIGGKIQALLDIEESRSTWERLVRRQEIGFGLTRALTKNAVVLPDAERVFDGTAPVVPLLRILRERIADPWTIDQMAREAQTSRASLNRQFLRLTGLSPMEYLRRLRLDDAAWRLLNTSSTAAQVAADVGYANQFHFSRQFSRRFGAPPSIYRRDRVFGEISAANT